MGFGYLLLGYLFAFLLKYTANIKPLSAGALAVALGCVCMAIGIWKLKDYEKSFRYPLVAVALLFVCNLYHCIEMVSTWAGAAPAWMTDDLAVVIGWLDFALVLLLHTLLLPAILRLAMSVELPKTAAAASRNLILTWIWGILVLVFMLAPLPKTPKKVILIAQNISNFAMILLNLMLLLSCTKNIAPEEEEEEQPPRRYRWEFLNRIGDRFFQEHERAAEKKKIEAEAFLRRRKERKNNKKSQK